MDSARGSASTGTLEFLNLECTMNIRSLRRRTIQGTFSDLVDSYDSDYEGIWSDYPEAHNDEILHLSFLHSIRMYVLRFARALLDPVRYRARIRQNLPNALKTYGVGVLPILGKRKR